MSDSYDYKTASYGSWLKLADFLRYFSLCEGMWIGKEAKFWYDAIADSDIRIDTELYTDSGGGPLAVFNITVIDTRKDEVLFQTNIEFQDTILDTVPFAQRMRQTYRYMRSYAGGDDDGENRPDTLWGLASADDFEDLDDFFNPRVWNDIFCGLEEVKEIELTEGEGVDIPLRNFQLAEAMCYNDADTLLKIAGKKELQIAKNWAAYVLLVMRRAQYTSC